jgi:hypothetical protein
LGSTVPLDTKNLSEQYHIVIISKPGVPFIDSVKMDEQTGFPIYKTPEEYSSRLSLDWRVNAANQVLNDVLKKVKVQNNKIAILGISEGFQVGAKLLTVNKKITHSILLVGNGLSQFYDFIIQNRMDAASGNISYEESQKNIDSLYKVYQDICLNSQSTKKEWSGHTYLRWSSFCKNKPMDNILSSSIPIYLVGSAKDRNTAVLSSDYLYLEAVEEGKQNITYKNYPYDHTFNEVITDDQGNVTSVKNHMMEVIEEALTWLQKN